MSSSANNFIDLLCEIDGTVTLKKGIACLPNGKEVNLHRLLGRASKEDARLSELYRTAAKRIWHREGEIEIDDDSLDVVSISSDGDGAYVQAWVWVSEIDIARGAENL